MKPLYFRNLSDQLKIKYMKEWERDQRVKTLTKLKRGLDVTVGMVCDPLEMNDE